MRRSNGAVAMVAAALFSLWPIGSLTAEPDTDLRIIPLPGPSLLSVASIRTGRVKFFALPSLNLVADIDTDVEHRSPGGATIAGIDGRFTAFTDAPARGALLMADNAVPSLLELAYRSDATPVFRGLVHDYRMGEAIALPARFTARVIPLPTPTLALWPGMDGYQVLRLDAHGAWSIVHLEVRREIQRLHLPIDADRPCDDDTCGGTNRRALAVAWASDERSGWIVGRIGDSRLAYIATGEPPRVTMLPLAGALTDLAYEGSQVRVTTADKSCTTLAPWQTEDVRDPTDPQHAAKEIQTRR